MWELKTDWEMRAMLKKEMPSPHTFDLWHKLAGKMRNLACALVPNLRLLKRGD